MNDCDATQAELLLARQPAPGAVAHAATCLRCRDDARAVHVIAAAFAADPPPIPSRDATERILAAAAPFLAAHARRLPAAAWRRLAAAVAVAVLPLPLILFAGWEALSAAHEFLSAVLPARIGLYLIAGQAAVVGLCLALTYGLLPVLAAHQLRLQHEESHA